MAHDVFISYSNVDKAVADAACATLERAGIRCWIAPRDIATGADWGAAIVNAIDNARVTILIFSSKANTSPQIRREVERSISVGATVMPVRIEDVKPTESLAYFMGTVHWLDAMTPPLEAHLEKLVATIKALLAVAKPVTAASSGAASGGSMHAGLFEAPPVSGREPVRIRRMFSETMNFSFQRNWLQAIGFYLVYLVVGLLFFATLGAIMGKVLGLRGYSGDEIFEISNLGGQFATIPYQLIIGVLLIWKRKKEPLNFILVIASVLLSTLMGSIGGLIPLAILSMRHVEKA
jgi:hypothetical protein